MRVPGLKTISSEICMFLLYRKSMTEGKHYNFKNFIFLWLSGVTFSVKCPYQCKLCFNIAIIEHLPIFSNSFNKD